MERRLLPLLLMFRAFVVILLVVFAAPSWSETLFGRVVGVSDGDTITVLDASRMQHKVRLAGIDAPEKKQGFGEVSKQNLARLVFGKSVTVDYEKRDRYDRIVGKVLVDGSDTCLRQIQDGWRGTSNDTRKSSRRLTALHTLRRKNKHASHVAVSGENPSRYRRGSSEMGGNE